MKTKGTVLKRTINDKTYYYHKYLDNGKQKNEIINEIEAYRLGFDIYFNGQDINSFLSHKFNLDVSFGESLFSLGKQYRSFKKRYCYQEVDEFISSPLFGKVLILYGLRRTGKTTLMFQSINSFSIKEFAKVAYIKCHQKADIYALLDDLKYLTNNGFSYIYIDEVTLLDDFISLASTLSDIYGLKAKIILSGTDSLGFMIAGHHELYDRYKMIHTTYISFKEFNDVLDIKSIDCYIEYGGTMSMEGIDYNKTIKNGKYQINEYVDSSIIHNIIHSLKIAENGKYFFNLYDLYEKNELENVINRIIEDSNHRFAISIIEQDFKSHGYGSLKQLLSLPRNYEKFHDVLEGVDEKKLTEDLMSALNIINKEKQTHVIDNMVLLELEQFLLDLDVIAFIDEINYPSFERRKKVVFTQPGLRYSQAKTLIELLLDNPKLKQYSAVITSAIKEKLLSDVKGRMIEDMIIYETSIKNKDTFKLYFDVRGEYDMVVINNKEMTADIYEIKYSEIIEKSQYRYLIDQEFNQIFEKKYYPIDKRIVLYRGNNNKVDNISYLKIEDYLMGL